MTSAALADADRADVGAAAGQCRLRILVVDDHEVVHWGFRLLFAGVDFVERCLGARTGEEAIHLTRLVEPHVALVDLSLRGESGADVCSSLRRESPAPQVLLISDEAPLPTGTHIVAGAAGVVFKDWSSDKLIEAVRSVMDGLTISESRRSRDVTFGLTPREQEVLDLMASGATNREIAGALYLSPHTIKEHARSVFRKLEVRNRTAAVQRAQRLGFIH